MNYHQLKQQVQNNLWNGENERGEFTRYFGVLSSILVEPDYSTCWGTDISHWDGIVNLSVTKSYGAEFVYIKAIDGTLQAKYFVENRVKAIEAGLLRGPYGWLYRDANVRCVAQAQAYSDLLGKHPMQLPAVIDFEPTKWGGVASNPTFSDLRKWAEEWLRLGNRKAILYSAAYYMNQFGTIPADLKDMFEGIWIAHYGTVNPTMPYGYRFDEWTFHQFASTGNAAKLSPNSVNKLEVDLDKAKSRDVLYRLGGVVSEPEPPPTGENEMLIYVNKVTTSALNGREAPGISSPVVATFQAGDLLICDDEQLVDGAYWRRVRACVRNGLNVPVPDAGVWSSDGTAGTLQGELTSFPTSVPVSLPDSIDAEMTYPDGVVYKGMLSKI